MNEPTPTAGRWWGARTLTSRHTTDGRRASSSPGCTPSQQAYRTRLRPAARRLQLGGGCRS